MPEKRVIRLGEFLVKAYDLAEVMENHAKEITGSTERATPKWRRITLELALEEMGRHYQILPEFTKDEAVKLAKECLGQANARCQERGLAEPFSEEDIQKLLPDLLESLGKYYKITE